MSTTGRPFTKMQAVGNDFVVVSEDGSDWPELAQTLCDRRFGIGGDGLLVIGRSAIAEARMRMFNPDGTEDMCGNGLRCVALVTGARSIETLVGVRAIAHNLDGSITTEMGFPTFGPEGQDWNTIDTGSVHTVLWCRALPDDAEFFAESPRWEHDPKFPERTSVLWAVVEAPNRLRLRIWERGVGETLGCGTGACAAAVLAKFTGHVRSDVEEIEIVSKGGVLRVRWDGGPADPMLLTGHAQTVYRGVWHAEG